MNREVRFCQNCKKDFAIEPEDFNFYEKVKVPPPTWCPECRARRRLSCTNSWSLFWRNCDKCGKKTLSMFRPDQKLTVYCQPCWWGDSWDGTEYAMDYDPKRPFLEQVKELAQKTPYATLESTYTTLKNCEYSNSIAYSKDCFMVIWADFCEFVYYSSMLNGLKSSIDCLRGWESELCYGSTGFIRSYRTFFCEEFDDCVDVWFSRNCYGCSNCFGCVNLRGASYQIFNVQYSKEDYNQKIKSMNLGSWANLKEWEKKARAFWLTKPYREFHGDSFNVNVTGEYAYQSRNAKEGYISNYVENSKYTQLITVAKTKDCMDYTGWGNNAEMLYECVQVGEGASNCKLTSHCFPEALNVEYCHWSMGGKNNFGCVNLKRKQYCILNKQYSKEEYERLKALIIKDMDEHPYKDEWGRVFAYGEFFSPGFSNFAYNNSNAMKIYPKTKEEILKEGWPWIDSDNVSYKISKKSSELPDVIKDTPESILEEVIECAECKRGYRIVKGELDLLRKMGLPLPHECPKCRENLRFERMNRPGMYHRKCDKCGEKIYTPYPPEDKRIVYCVKDYQAEFA